MDQRSEVGEHNAARGTIIACVRIHGEDQLPAANEVRSRSRRGSRTRVYLVTSVTAGVLAFSACAGSGDAVPTASATPDTTVEELLPVPGAFVGQVENSDLFIAVVPGEDGTVEAYSCDGTDTTGTVDQWFRGDWDGRSPVTLTGGGFQLGFDRHADTISGQLTTPGGDRLPFRATPAETGEGLHVLERRDAATGEVIDRDGLIVNDNDRRGAMAPLNTRCRYITKRRYDVATGQYVEHIVQICS